MMWNESIGEPPVGTRIEWDSAFERATTRWVVRHDDGWQCWDDACGVQRGHPHHHWGPVESAIRSSTRSQIYLPEWRIMIFTESHTEPAVGSTVTDATNPSMFARREGRGWICWQCSEAHPWTTVKEYMVGRNVVVSNP